jgi:hypothetical protein
MGQPGKGNFSMTNVAITARRGNKNSNAPFPHLDRAALSSTGHVPAALRGEENDYLAVAALNDGWRVIVCKNSIQWILQRRRAGPDSWRGRSFCCTREALVRCARQHAGDIAADALVILLRLPERIGGSS